MTMFSEYRTLVVNHQTLLLGLVALFKKGTQSKTKGWYESWQSDTVNHATLSHIGIAIDRGNIDQFAPAKKSCRCLVCSPGL